MSYKMPIKEGKEDTPMYVRKDTGPLFGMNEIGVRSMNVSTCVLQSRLGFVYKLPEGHEGEQVTFLNDAFFAGFDEYEVFFEQ